MIKVSDYVVAYLVEHGITDIFMVVGGGIMHLVDSVGRNQAIRYYCNRHEQASAISAEAYAKSTGRIGACLVTTGPGSTNALSGIAGAWVDSLPVLVISGQVRRDLIADYSSVRQIGPQEGNTIAMAQPVTKRAVTVLDPLSIRYELDAALHEATSGRPGPVWLDIPLDVQDARVEEDELRATELNAAESSKSQQDLVTAARIILEELSRSRRPLLTCGNGVHLSNSEQQLRQLIDRLGIPVVLPYTAKDLLPEDHPLNLGVFGTSGQRRANFAVQNADCLVSLATGLNTAKVGFNFPSFAPKARKVIVDIDEGQLSHQVISPDIAIRADIKALITEVLRQSSTATIQPSPSWLDACARWKQRYPVLEQHHKSRGQYVDSYEFMYKLAEHLTGDDVLVTGNGLDCVSYWHSFRVKDGQRTMLNGNWGSMGWDLPAAIGACIGSDGRRTICVTGDGSIQLNLQELLTISYYQLPIKMFVLNNEGYSTIRATQHTFFEDRHVGSDLSSGLNNPDFELLARAMHIQYSQIDSSGEMDNKLRQILSARGPALCELRISPSQGISPKASAYKREDGTMESRPLEDMFPFLPREEISENMYLFD